ncbi:MAG: type 2 isopentenyl-diphosphate Delta-isomerase [Thermoplasmatota archaeon]
MTGPTGPGTRDEAGRTTSRKQDHVDAVLREDVRARHNAWGDLTFVHEALPEVNLGDVDIKTDFLGHRLGAPIMIASMTGGYPDAERINGNLAEAAAAHGLALGVGSQRAALRAPSMKGTFSVVRKHDVPFVAANIGVPQLIHQGSKPPLSKADIQDVISMVNADALIVHLNFLQEVVQPEGDHAARGALEAIRDLAKGAGIPLIAKETGAGIRRSTAHRLRNAGVAAIDVGGLAGTTFAAVELVRARAEKAPLQIRIGELFRDWGIPTPVSVLECVGEAPVVATGGLSTGLDVAKSLALGAALGGIASAGLQAADRGPKEAAEFFAQVIAELRTTCFLTGCGAARHLNRASIIARGPTAEWMAALGYSPVQIGGSRGTRPATEAL